MIIAQQSFLVFHVTFNLFSGALFLWQNHYSCFNVHISGIFLKHICSGRSVMSQHVLWHPPNRLRIPQEVRYWNSQSPPVKYLNGICMWVKVDPAATIMKQPRRSEEHSCLISAVSYLPPALTGGVGCGKGAFTLSSVKPVHNQIRATVIAAVLYTNRKRCSRRMQKEAIDELQGFEV